jgi:pyruvate/2-oxoglutarate dehydrogenase complex dihydrolipoamide dehydrogenase (E3) component
LHVHARRADGTAVSRFADVVLVVTGVRSNTGLAASAGEARVQERDRGRLADATSLPSVFAAGDCVVTWRRLGGVTYLPLGTTAHKQDLVAGENALGRCPGVRRQPRHAGGEDLRPCRRPRRLRDHEAAAAPAAGEPPSGG